MKVLIEKRYINTVVAVVQSVFELIIFSWKNGGDALNVVNGGKWRGCSSLQLVVEVFLCICDSC